jgi:putative Holliday junction resolvase
VGQADGTELDVITVSDEDGNQHEFTVLEYVEVQDRQYVVVVPSDAPDDEAAVILRVEGDTLVGVQDQEEFDRVVLALESEHDDLEVEVEDDEPLEGGSR